MSNITKELLFLEAPPVVSVHMDDLVIPQGQYNDNIPESIDFGRFKGLKSINIGDNCFQNVNSVRIVGMKELKAVSIGTNSFSKQTLGRMLSDSDGTFTIADCDVLTSLSIGPLSFVEYTSFNATGRKLRVF